MPTYHDWLQDPHLQEMTATEPVDLQTEYDYQQELAHSTDSTRPYLISYECVEFTKLIQEKESKKLVGDINLFFNHEEDSAELNIMIADADARRKNLASEALVLVMVYAVQRYNVRQFFVKVLGHNEAALRFFEKHGFKRDGLVDAFGEQKMTLKSDDLPRTNLEIKSA